MSELEKVSVIVPVYNQVEFLEEAIQSVLNQTYQKFEILLINDCSAASINDLIDVICQKYPEIHRIDLPQNEGVSHARNVGIDTASGEYLLFLDADDTLSLETIAKAVNILRVQPDADVVISEGEVFTDGKLTYSYFAQKQVFIHNKKKYRDRPVSDDHYFLIYNPMIHSMLFRKEVFEKARFPEDLRYGEDRYLWMELRSRGVRFVKADWLGAYYRLRPKSFNRSNHTENQYRFFEKLWSAEFVLSSFEKKYLNFFLLVLAVRTGKSEQVVRSFFRALLAPFLTLGLGLRFLGVRFMASFKYLFGFH